MYRPSALKSSRYGVMYNLMIFIFISIFDILILTEFREASGGIRRHSKAAIQVNGINQEPFRTPDFLSNLYYYVLCINEHKNKSIIFAGAK